MKNSKKLIEGGDMQRGSALIAVCFAAGVIGALFNSAAVWFSVKCQLTTFAKVAISPDFSLQWLYPRLIWGGIWGLVFYLTVGKRSARRRWIRKGLWVSLLPTAVQLLFIFPYRTGHDLLGFGLGTLTPVFVFSYNLVWGFVTGFFTRLLWGKE
jgi:hypothetical protein